MTEIASLNARRRTPDGTDLAATFALTDDGTLAVINSISLTDTGGGIPEAIRPRIFESFLSGRADGTGLGLAIARRIMKDHHGELTLLTTSPRGTTMRVTLPLSAN